MSYYTAKPNYNPTYGHYCFMRAVEHATEAANKLRGRGGVEPDVKEAFRLYRVAILDAEIGLKEVAADADWAIECRGIVESMQGRIAAWRLIIEPLGGSHANNARG